MLGELTKIRFCPLVFEYVMPDSIYRIVNQLNKRGIHMDSVNQKKLLQVSAVLRLIAQASSDENVEIDHNVMSYALNSVVDDLETLATSS